MKVNIKEWNAVATWRWDMLEDDVCGICRVQFDGTCPTCKFPGDDCSLCQYLHLYLCGLRSERVLISHSARKMRSFLPYALSDDLDSTRNVQRTLSNVSTEI
ncbi:anaphase-promoting complex subunit 11 RING-H2 finger-domain-containing protein [Aspergillus floccosus]